MNVRRIVVSVLALALVVVAAPAPADTFRVKAAGDPGTYHWQPDFRHISKGDKIVWKNPTSANHTVTAYKGPWSKNSTIKPGERTSFRFRKNGSYKYRCKTPGHSTLTNGECNGMCGEIHVM